MDHPRRTQILESILSTVPGGEEFLQSVSSFRIDDELEVGNRGPDEWAIRWTNLCYTKDGRWLREPQPSNRTEEFITASRFPLREAFSLVDDAKRSIEAILDEEDRQYREGLR